MILDYSHGQQLVHQTVDVMDNGVYHQSNLFDLLKQPKYANILNAGDVYSPATQKGAFDATSTCYSWCSPEQLAQKKCSVLQNDPWLKAIRAAFPDKK